MATKTENKRKKGPGRPPKSVGTGMNDIPATDDLVKMFRDMLLIRRFEEKAGQMYGMGQIGGFCHLYIGQEAVVVGLQSASVEGDTVVTSYRDHGHMLACGMEAGGVMAELTGREGGYSRGKGGSMHMFSREKNFFGGHGIVGAQVPIGVGLAFSHKYKDKDDLLLAVNDQFVQEYMKVYLADMVDKPLSEQLVWLVNQLKPFNGLITTVHNRIHSSEAVHKWHAGFHALMERLLIMQLPGAQPTDGFDADIQIISFTIEGMISHDLNQKDINKICQALTQRIGGV